MRSLTSRLESLFVPHYVHDTQSWEMRLSGSFIPFLFLQNQLQKLRTEEVLRQQSSLKSCAAPEVEEEEEDESSNSTTSSPCLRHKDQQSSRYNSQSILRSQTEKLK